MVSSRGSAKPNTGSGIGGGSTGIKQPCCPSRPRTIPLLHSPKNWMQPVEPGATPALFAMPCCGRERRQGKAYAVMGECWFALPWMVHRGMWF